MNKDNFYKAKELNHTLFCLNRLKDMVKDRYFKLKTQKKFSDYYSELDFYEMDAETRKGIEKAISDYCNKRIEEINKTFETL